MAHSFECPKCKQDISDSYQDAEPDVGISAGYYCDACNEGFADDSDHYHDDDVPLFGTGGHFASDPRCPKCLSTNLEMGYGLAGGGMGPYSYCPRCEIVVNKSQDPT